MSTPSSILPPQVAPIDRTLAGAAAVSTRTGINASIAFEPQNDLFSQVCPGGFCPIV